MSPARTSLGLALALFAAGLGAGGAVGQSQTEAARADGKAFGSDALGKAQDAAKTAPTADRVPGFVGTPSQSALFDDPDAIAAQAASAASSNEGYATVRSSLDRRPRVAVDDIAATVSRGRAISANPTSYVSGMSIGGGQGSCRELPPSIGSSGTYEATCNVGVALEQSTATCTATLLPKTVEHVAYRYWAENPAHTGLSPSMADFAGALADGRCVVEGPADSCQVVRNYGLQPSSRCSRLGTNVVRCSEELPNLSGNPVPATGKVWFQQAIDRTVETSLDESACSALAGDAGCTRQSEDCTSSDPVTRLIDGVSVTRPCWAWSRSYQCHKAVPAENCDALEADKGCRFEREQCLTDEDPCPTKERIYSCPVPDGPAPEKQYVCNGDVYCINGECETIDRQPNDEFKDAAVALNAAAQAGKEFDPAKLTLFKGERDTCHSKVFGILNCCAGKAFPLIPAAQLLVSLGCDREEVLLHQRDAQGLCHYVGSYCSDSVFGICVTKKKTYCCFESKLSRILQEQGRAQINKPWGSPKKESCQGFTIDEFARLDLSRMDFSEVYAEFQDAAKLPDELGTVATLQQKIADYYAVNGGGR